MFAWKDTHQLLPRLPLPIQFREYEEQDWRVGAVTSGPLNPNHYMRGEHVLKVFEAEGRTNGRTDERMNDG